VATVSQIAELAGVSVEELMRVLMGQPVSDAVNQRVLEALAQLEAAENSVVPPMAARNGPVLEESEQTLREPGQAVGAEPEPAKDGVVPPIDALSTPAIEEREEQLPEPGQAVGAEPEPAKDGVVPPIDALSTPAIEEREEQLPEPGQAVGAEPVAETEDAQHVVDVRRQLQDLFVRMSDEIEAAEIPANLPSTPDASFHGALLELRGALFRFEKSLDEMRREADSNRAAQIKDIALLVHLVVTGWQAMDSRLGRLEQIAERSHRETQ
jgi:hypothetical protein